MERKHGGDCNRKRALGSRSSTGPAAVLEEVDATVLGADAGFWPATCAARLVGVGTLGVLIVTSSIQRPAGLRAAAMGLTREVWRGRRAASIVDCANGRMRGDHY